MSKSSLACSSIARAISASLSVVVCFFGMICLPVHVIAQSCTEYTQYLRQSEQALGAMPSTTLAERQTKRRQALSQIAYIDTTRNPCSALYSQVDARRRYDDWVRLVRLQGVMESLWPDLSTEGEFASADRLSARLAKTRLFGLHRLYRPQAWEYRARIMLDYGHYGSQESFSRTRVVGLYEEALNAYDAAAVLYEALTGAERYSITYLQMKGYRAEVLCALSRLAECGCAAAWASERAVGSEAKVRKFRADMRRLLNRVDIEGSDWAPAVCDTTGDVLRQHRAIDWWITLLAVTLVGIFLVWLCTWGATRRTAVPKQKQWLNFPENGRG